MHYKVNLDITRANTIARLYAWTERDVGELSRSTQSIKTQSSHLMIVILRKVVKSCLTLKLKVFLCPLSMMEHRRGGARYINLDLRKT